MYVELCHVRQPSLSQPSNMYHTNDARHRSAHGDCLSGSRLVVARVGFPRRTGTRIIYGAGGIICPFICRQVLDTIIT